MMTLIIGLRLVPHHGEFSLALQTLSLLALCAEPNDLWAGAGDVDLGKTRSQQQWVIERYAPAHGWTYRGSLGGGFQSHVSDFLQVGVRTGEVVCRSVNTLSLPSNPHLGLSQARW